MKNGLRTICDALATILAIVLLIVLIVQLLDANLHFLDKVPVLLNIFKGVFYYGVLILIALVGLEAVFSARHPIVWLIIFGILLAAAIILMFFPGTFQNFMNFVKKS